MVNVDFALQHPQQDCPCAFRASCHRRSHLSLSLRCDKARLPVVHIPGQAHAPATPTSPAASSTSPPSLAASAPAVAQLKFPSHGPLKYERGRGLIASPSPSPTIHHPSQDSTLSSSSSSSLSPSSSSSPPSSSAMAEFPSKNLDEGAAELAARTAADLESCPLAPMTADGHQECQRLPNLPTGPSADPVGSNSDAFAADGGSLHESLPKHQTASPPPLPVFPPYTHPSAPGRPESIPSPPPHLPPTPPADSYQTTVQWEACSSRRASNSISPTQELTAQESSPAERSPSVAWSYGSKTSQDKTSSVNDDVEAKWTYPALYPTGTASARNTTAGVSNRHQNQDADITGSTSKPMRQPESPVSDRRASSGSVPEARSEYDSQEWLLQGIALAVSHLHVANSRHPKVQVVSQTMPGPAITSPDTRFTIVSPTSSKPSVLTSSPSRKSGQQGQPQSQTLYKHHVSAFNLVLGILFSQMGSTRSPYVTITHALSPSFSLSGLPAPVPRSTLSPALSDNEAGGDGSRDSYFSIPQQKIFVTATPAPCYTDSPLQSPHTPRTPSQQSEEPCRRTIMPPMSVDIAAIERYIPASSAQEYKNLFSGDADSCLVDRLMELNAHEDGGGGSLVVIYPTKKGGETFQRSYLAPVYDPVIRQLIVGKGLSSDVGSQLGKIPSMSSLEEFEDMANKLEAMCTAVSDKANEDSARHRLDQVLGGEKDGGNDDDKDDDEDDGEASEFSLAYAAKGHIRLCHKIWTEWFIQQDLPRARRVLNTHQNQRPSLQLQHHMVIPSRTQSHSQARSSPAVDTPSSPRANSMDSNTNAMPGSPARPGLLSSKITDEDGLPMNLNLSLNMNMNDWMTPHPTVMKPVHDVSATTLLQELADGLRFNSSFRQEKQEIEPERMEIGVFVIQRKKRSTDPQKEEAKKG